MKTNTTRLSPAAEEYCARQEAANPGESRESRLNRRKSAERVVSNARSMSLPGVGTHARAVRVEVRAAPTKLALLEKEAAELDAKLIAAKAMPSVVQRRQALANERDVAKENLVRRTVAVEQAEQEAAAFQQSAAVASDHLDNARTSIERLEAATFDDLSRLAEIQEAITALEFFAETHAARCKSCEARIKTADGAKAAAAADLKKITADFTEVDRQLAETQAQLDANAAA